VYIPNIIDERFFAGERRPEPALVLFTGGARAIKGWPLLAEAWPAVQAAVPEARLLAVGWEGEPRSEPAQRYADSIRFESWLSSQELASRMASASVLVVASEFEVSPIVVGEAWAIGLPIVATPVGGLTSLVEGAGLVVSRRDPSALARGIVHALRGSETVERFAAEGRHRAEAHRAGAVIHAHLDLYNELLGVG
jgi:glycosyltransferase involved in cell wall biosynthesis